MFHSALVVGHGDLQRRAGKFVVCVGGKFITLMYDSSVSREEREKGECWGVFIEDGPPQGMREVLEDRRFG